MARDYPVALRWRVVYLLYLEGLGVSEVASALRVGKTFVMKIRDIYRRTHSVDYSSNRGKTRKLDVNDILLIRTIIQQYPETYEDEIRDWINYVSGKSVSGASISRYLKRIGYSRRKLNVVARQRDEIRRAEYRRRMSAFDRHQLLFIDESAKDERTFQRRHAWDLKGTGRISVKGNFTRGSRYSVLGAISVQGVVASHVILGAYNQAQFEFAFENFILPHVGSVARREACSVVVLDNCNIHYSLAVADAVRNKGGIIMFLPPYSPDFNPIEDCFNFAKQWLQRNQYVCGNHPKRCFEIALDQVTQVKCQGFFNDCGYH